MLTQSTRQFILLRYTQSGCEFCLLFLLSVFPFEGKINWQQSDIAKCRTKGRMRTIVNETKIMRVRETKIGMERVKSRVRLTISDNYEYNIKITQYYKGALKSTRKAKNYKANSGNCSFNVQLLGLFYMRAVRCCRHRHRISYICSSIYKLC